MLTIIIDFIMLYYFIFFSKTCVDQTQKRCDLNLLRAASASISFCNLASMCSAHTSSTTCYMPGTSDTILKW